MQYDIEADWFLTRTCNFRCSYCFFPPQIMKSKVRLYGNPAQWQEGFNATSKTWLLHITGGEPSLYPDFVELCEKLTEKHYLSINTNLTSPCLVEFTKRIDPERVHFINAAIHFEERQKRGLWRTFFDRVHELLEAKFNVLFSLVMTPQVIQNFPGISDFLEAEGIVAIPKIIRGFHEGKCYPSSYSLMFRTK